jgi:hypothetical protein
MLRLFSVKLKLVCRIGVLYDAGMLLRRVRLVRPCPARSTAGRASSGARHRTKFEGYASRNRGNGAGFTEQREEVLGFV